ncbi:hypothetical protein PVAG01_03683 [Phlyctema vagabunda]|uniref:BTB domain-containing protein n=1 Tax=Phlyctema vagabunda TaxID=108571 RepID=A0ABR4PMT4_9HELO
MSELPQAEEEAKPDKTKRIFKWRRDNSAGNDLETTASGEVENSTCRPIESAIRKLRSVFIAPGRPANKEIMALCSAKHLILSSVVFRAMLQDEFKEGLELNSTGKVTIPLPEDDAQALLLILRIIHGPASKVPDAIDLPTLALVATLTDKYQVHHWVDYFAQLWIERLRDELPTTIRPLDHSGEMKCMIWLTIAWVFKRKRKFKAITRVLEREGMQSRLSTHILIDGKGTYMPIPSPIIDAIDKRRIDTLTELLAIIPEYVERLSTGGEAGASLCTKSGCDAEHPSRFVGLVSTAAAKSQCEGMLLGTLIRAATAVDLWPVPDPHQVWISCTTLKEHIEAFRIYSFCGMTHKDEPDSSHGLRSMIADSVEAVIARLDGVELETFL